MKKIISSILCLAMVLSLGVSAFAETNDFVLTYTNEASYEISIPESGNINTTTGKGTIIIGVSEANLEEGTTVSVTAFSSNYNDGWYLVNTKDSSDTIAYTIGTTDGGSDVVSGDEVLNADTPTSATLYVTVSDISKVGTFTDTITFTSEIVDKIITFTIDGNAYQAVEGMTWREWIGSEYDNTTSMSALNSPSDAADDVQVMAGAGWPLLSSKGENVLIGDKIITNEAYELNVDTSAYE